MANITYITADEVSKLIIKKPNESSKADFGRLLNIAGSLCFTGAAFLSTKAALMGGCGYVYLASTIKVIDRIAGFIPEAVFINMPENNSGSISAEGIKLIRNQIKNITSISIGCGLTNGDDSLKLTKYVLSDFNIPTVIDADSLNVISDNRQIMLKLIAERNGNVILTPHFGEFCRLINKDKAIVEKDKIAYLAEFATSNNAIVLLKGHTSYVCDTTGEIYAINNGSAGMAKAGSGDVLTGLIGSLSAMGLTQTHAACCGAFIHGLAGSYAAQSYSVNAMRAENIIECIGKVYLTFDR